MITPTVGRVLAKLEAESLDVAGRGKPGEGAHDGAVMSVAALRLLQGDGVLIARMAKALNFETRGVGV